MNILRVITRLNIGGPARQAVYLHHSLQKGEWDEFLIYGQLDSDEGDFEGHLSLRNKSLKSSSLVRPLRPFTDLICTLKIFFWLTQHPIDLIHTHTAKAGMTGRGAAIFFNFFAPLLRKKRITIVHTYHGHVFSGYFSPRKTRLIKSIEKWLWKKSDAIVTLTPGLAKEITTHLGVTDQKIEIISLGLNLEPFLEVKRSSFFTKHFSLDRNPLWVGWVGRLAEIKNPLRFLDIAEKISQTLDEQVAFVLVGDGPLREKVEEVIAQKKLTQSVYLYGWSHDLEEIYGGLDFFINSSDNEGTPVAVLEALSSGLSLAATRVGGTAELIEEQKGISFFEPDNWEAKVPEWCRWILGQKRQSQEIRESIVDRFSQKRLLKKLKNLYLEIHQ